MTQDQPGAHPWWHWFFTFTVERGSVTAMCFGSKPRYYRVTYCQICKKHTEIAE